MGGLGGGLQEVAEQAAEQVRVAGPARRKMLRVGLPPVLDDLDQDGTLRPGSTLRPKSLG